MRGRRGGSGFLLSVCMWKPWPGSVGAGRAGIGSTVALVLLKTTYKNIYLVTHLEANTTYHAALVQNNIEEIFSSGGRKRVILRGFLIFVAPERNKSIPYGCEPAILWYSNIRSAETAQLCDGVYTYSTKEY
jgi:hypothetical protein